MSNTMGARRRHFTTTIDYLNHPQFAARATLIHRPKTSTLRDGLRIAAGVLKAAVRRHPLLLTSSWGNIHPDLLASAIIGLWPRRLRPTIVLMGCMWEPTGGWRGRMERLLVRLADRAITRYAVQSTAELTLFPQTWGIDPAKLHRCLYFYTIDPDDIVPEPRQIAGSGHVFAGGNAQRDYAPLLEAARRLPHIPFVFATKLLDGQPLPTNVTAGQVPHQQFMELLQTAVANIVPIRHGLHRAAGQQTYLNSMWLGVPTVVADSPGVADHIQHQQTGLVVNNTPAAYVQTIEWLLAPENQPQIAAMTRAARHAVDSQFSFTHHVDCILAIMDDVLAIGN
ncbi:MAG: glycosyltransferase [Ardenticatenaceae bacterium]|nr:glycosyltransferase [Ardenticatenaceae bacterium]